MEKCPFFAADLCDAEHPIENIPGFDRSSCIAMRYLWTKEHDFPIPAGTEVILKVPDHFLCDQDGSKV